MSVLPNVKIQDHSNEADPYLLVIDSQGELLNRFNTMTPTQTVFTEMALKGGSAQPWEYLDKADAVTEEQLKSIYPYAAENQSLNPLTTTDMTIIHDNIRREGNTKRALMYLGQGMLGKDPTITLDVSRKFATESRRKAELDAILQNEANLTMLETLMDIDEMVNLYDRMLELIFAGHGFGRSAALKQYDRRGLPCNLIPLSSVRLGRVYTDLKTKQFLGVEYLDYNTKRNILMAKDLVYYCVDDFQISPNSRYYGMPATESSMYIAQSNRVANEISKPEIISKMWAPLMIIKSKSRSRQKLTEIRNAFVAGKITFINNDLDIQVVPLQHDLEKLDKVVSEQSKQIYRDATVPLVVGFQDEQNRATAEASLQQWYDGPLQFKRTHLNNVVWTQWYKPILEKLYEDNEMMKLNETGGNPLQYMSQRAQGLIERPLIPFKVKMVFTNIRAAGFLDMSTGILAYHEAGLVTDDIARNEVGLGQYNTQIHEEELAKQALRAEAMGSNNMLSQALDQKNAIKDMNKQPKPNNSPVQQFP